MLIGCGGGGSEPDAGQRSPSANQIAWRDFIAGSRSFTVTGFGRNDATLVEVDLFTYNFRFDASDTAVFPLTGEAATRLVRRDSLAAQSSGPTPFSVATLEMFFSNDLRLLGTRLTQEGFPPVCTLATSRLLFPSDFATGIALNSSGPLATLQPQFSCALPLSPAVGDTELRWAYNFESGIRFLCLQFRSANSGSSRFSENCVELNPDSTIGTRSRVTLPNIPNPVIMRNY
jgi:hypothetical protein